METEAIEIRPFRQLSEVSVVSGVRAGSVSKVLLVFLKALLSKAFKNTNNISRT
jgi:hypothetical protein